MSIEKPIERLRFWAGVAADDETLYRPTDRALALTSLALGAVQTLGHVPGFFAYANGRMTLEDSLYVPNKGIELTASVSLCAGDPDASIEQMPHEHDPLFWLQITRNGAPANGQCQSYDLTFNDVVALVSLTHQMSTNMRGLWRRAVTAGAQEDVTVHVTDESLIASQVAARLDITALHAHQREITTSMALHQSSDDTAARHALITHWVHAGTSAVTTT